MKFCIITHVNHFKENNIYFSYSPYVREMNIWLRHIDELVIVAPSSKKDKSKIDIAYLHPKIEFTSISQFNVTSLGAILKSVVDVPFIMLAIYRAMKKADHIHLRCPGNVGLLGCLVQIFFPAKPKTAKYAGNWDPKSKQPLSYRLQKWILSNIFLTKNMQVLVYGEWPNQSKNIKPFFTATYRESDKTPITKRNLQGEIRFVFAGTLSSGKRPMFALQLVEQLLKKNINVYFDIYGEGAARESLENFILKNKLSEFVALHGNQKETTLRTAYQKAHFLILPSKSEGWPKVVAEAMFWGCVPISSAVSCVPNMLDSGNRGILLSMDLEKDVVTTEELIRNEEAYHKMSLEGAEWSRRYTLDKFEQEIKKLLRP